MGTEQSDDSLSYEDFLNWTLTTLKDYLGIRGLKQTGRKAELVARAFGAYELNAPKKFTQEQISENIKKEYNKRLEINKISSDPNSLPDDAWKDNVADWPKLDDGKLFSYILKVKAVDVDYIGKYKDEKAYSYWMSGFVDTVFVASCPKDSTLIFLKGNVCPSQRIREDPHKVWICVKGQNSPSIITSWCTCIAGTGEVCNHVIAILYKVNYAYHKNFISPACTSIPQGWNRGTRREVTPSQLQNLTFRRDKKLRKLTNKDPVMGQTLKKAFDPRRPQDRNISDESVSNLLSDIKRVLPTACVLYSFEHGVDDSLPPTLASKALNFMANGNHSGKTLEVITPLFIEHCQLSSEQVHQIEISTRGQHKNNAWFEQRSGRITASRFHEVATKCDTIMKKRGKKVIAYSPLVFQLLGKSADISHIPAIAWGQTHEKNAIQAFLSDVASQHVNGLHGFRSCRLFVKSSYPYLAGSPDGMFVCNCCPPSTIEVKCPYSVRDSDLFSQDVYKKVDFLEQVDGNLRLKRSHKYYAQVQGQMWVCGVQQCYFIVWTQFNKPLYEKILFDHAHCDSLVNKLTIFYKTYVLPCLLGFRELQECPHCEKVILQESEVNNPAEEYSITCCTCKTSWHLCCAHVTESTAKSSESWLCFSCLADTCNTGGDDFDHLSSEGDDVNIGASTSTASSEKSVIPFHDIGSSIDTCPVCFDTNIPVGGMHVCSLCRKKVHAWCSNHEDITDSSNLICKNCL